MEAFSAVSVRLKAVGARCGRASLARIRSAHCAATMTLTQTTASDAKLVGVRLGDGPKGACSTPANTHSHIHISNDKVCHIYDHHRGNIACPMGKKRCNR